MRRRGRQKKAKPNYKDLKESIIKQLYTLERKRMSLF